MVLFYDIFIMLPVRNVKHLFTEVAMEMETTICHYMNVNNNAQVSNVCIVITKLFIVPILKCLYYSLPSNLQC